MNTNSTSSGNLLVLNLLSTLITLPLRLVKALRYPLQRILYLGLARVDIPTLPASAQIDGRIHVVGPGNIKIGERCRISRDVELGTEASGRIDLADEVRINRGTTLFAYDEITIGQGTLIGEFVTIRDANHGIAADQPVRKQAHDSAPIGIGKDVWIGRGSVILPGVQIGDGAIIGANSVVTRSLGPGVIAVGSPARVIKRRAMETEDLDSFTHSEMEVDHVN